jgi:hypothetical protein
LPEKLESIRESIAKKLRGKINPRTKKTYTEDDFWAIATATYKKLKGGK